MQTEDQKALGAVLEQLNPVQVRKVLDFARKLRQGGPVKDQSGEEDLDYSDTWSDEDIEDWREVRTRSYGAGDMSPR